MRGTVVSAKAQKSVVVAVERIFKHPVVKKFVKERSKFMAHDELDQFKVGDEIWIEEHRPISRRKRFMVRTCIDESCGRLVRARIRHPDARFFAPWEQATGFVNAGRPAQEQPPSRAE
jgi:small subunit ribosomal protein S17